VSAARTEHAAAIASAERAIIDAAKTYEALDRHSASAGKPGDFVRALAGVRETVRALRDVEGA
jgi:hypothetical protein